MNHTDPTETAEQRADVTGDLVPRAGRPIDMEHDELMARAAAEHESRTAAEKARKDADRAAVLLWAADRIDATREPFPIAVQNGISWATAELRRLAAEAQQTQTETPSIQLARRSMDALARKVTGEPDSYEATTGHLATCLTVAGGEADPDCGCARAADCLFCQPDTPTNRVTARTPICYSRLDNYPAAPGHIEIVPARHVESIFDLTPAELADVHQLLRQAAAAIGADGYTIGVNEGRAAGRTVDHVHIHVIPRWHGDVEDPRGGVRRVLPGQDPDQWAAPVVPVEAAADDEETQRWCKCRDCWGWFVEEHPGEDLDELGRDLGWWSGLPEHRDAPGTPA